MAATPWPAKGGGDGSACPVFGRGFVWLLRVYGLNLKVRRDVAPDGEPAAGLQSRELTPDPRGTSFWLLFRRRPDAGRFWKDVMAWVLRERVAAGVTTSLLYWGDTEPQAAEVGP